MRELPKELKRNLEQQLTVPHAELCELARPIELLRQLGAIYSPLRDASDRAAATFQRALQHQASESTLLPAEGLEAREHGQIVDALLAASNQLRARSEPANEELRKLEHAFLATLVAIFVPRYLRHFRLYVMPVLVGSVLGVLMTSLYFVQPQRLITSVIFVWVTGMVLVSFWIYSSLDRTPVISAIGNTTEGAVDFDWTLVSRIVTWGLVPLLSLFAAQYPSFSNAVSWLANGLGKALR
jgi:hypothetical protein